MAMPYPDDEFIPLWETGAAGGGTTDERIRRRLADRLARACPALHPRLTVSVQNRVAILDGAVDTDEHAEIVKGHAWSTPGVHDVCNALTVRHGG